MKPLDTYECGNCNSAVSHELQKRISSARRFFGHLERGNDGGSLEDGACRSGHPTVSRAVLLIAANLAIEKSAPLLVRDGMRIWGTWMISKRAIDKNNIINDEGKRHEMNRNHADVDALDHGRYLCKRCNVPAGLFCIEGATESVVESQNTFTAHDRLRFFSGLINAIEAAVK